jgi:hypothetical protein
MLLTYLTLRFLPIQNTDAYWARIPTPVLKSMIDECFQAAWTGRGTREYHIDTLKMLFKYMDENHPRFRSTLIRQLHQYYTEHPEELTLGDDDKNSSGAALHSLITNAASGDSSNTNHTLPT